MSLDLGAVGRQIAHLGEVLVDRREGEEDRLRRALSLLDSAADVDLLAAKIARSRTAWRPALPVEPLTIRCRPVDPPTEFSVLASDGSTIEPDRHGSALCYLINIGLVALHYGARPQAALYSVPSLGFRDEDLYVQAGEQQILVAGPLLSIRRQTLESERLAALAESVPSERVSVALQDGTLILGTLEGSGLERWLQAQRVLKPLLDNYSRFRALGVPLAAYASRPRHGDVVNALRVLACPEPQPDCQKGCRFQAQPTPPGGETCRALARLSDRVLFRSILSPRERSAVFLSQWPISVDNYGEHKVHFFYLHAGPEIARVEVPEWVARDKTLVDLVHAAVVDQCERGRGYPTALLEAHEQAVLRAADRRQFESIVEAALVRAGLPTTTSEKERGKRLRAL
mgnify:CR=1 FL=1